jgi:hypothetical protein
MQLHAEAVRACAFEDAPRLVRRKGDALAEGIDGIGEMLARHRRDDVGADVRDIVVGAPCEFRRDGVRGEERGADAHAAIAEGARDTQAFQLVVQIEAVPRFDLDGGHPFARQRLQADSRLAPQLHGTCGAGRAHRGKNPATGARDLLVRRAFKAKRMLRCARAPVDQVRVAIDEPGRHQRAFRVDDLRAAIARRFAGRPDPGEPAVLDAHRTIFDERIASAAHRGDARMNEVERDHARIIGGKPRDMPSLLAPDALLPAGWARDVLLEWDDGGMLTRVEAESKDSGAPRAAGRCCRECPTSIRMRSSAPWPGSPNGAGIPRTTSGPGARRCTTWCGDWSPKTCRPSPRTSTSRC